VGRGRPYAILRYICHKGAFHVRQTGSAILGSEHRTGEGLAGYLRGGKEKGVPVGGGEFGWGRTEQLVTF